MCSTLCSEEETRVESSLWRNDYVADSASKSMHYYYFIYLYIVSRYYIMCHIINER